jgi:para-aminobenzoate synthetase component 1
MPPGAASEGRCIIANDNTAGYNPRNVTVTMVEQFQSFSKRRHCVWLDTACPDQRGASGEGISLLAANPTKVFHAKGERGVFERLRAELEGWHGYAIGYFGYDLKNEIERLPARATDDLGLPDCWFGFYENVTVSEVGRDRRARRCVDESHGRPGGPSLPTSNFTRDSYRAMILRAKEYIAAGDVYQVNLSQRFQCDVNASPADAYLALRATNPAPYCAYLDIGDAQILSSSPECFLNIHDRHVITRPIKGTIPRERDPKELLCSPKDNAELLMITDLERNDLGKVCEFGSVAVRELKRVETYATVHHLVATVEGTLRGGVSHVDCVRACFPGGSITGAPKIRAMEIIDELEPHARGVYCGAIGYFGPNRESHFNIAIRTMVYQSRGSGFQRRPVADTIRSHDRPTGRLTFHAGGGIVADSKPDAEYDETLAKARGILNAIEQLRVR